MQHWSKMYLISASYMQLFFYPFLLQKQLCLRWCSHSSMSVLKCYCSGSGPSWVLLQVQISSCEKRETLRSTKQSKKEFDLPSLAESCEKREMLCSAMCCWSTRIHSSLEQLSFLKCCSSSGWIWTDQDSLMGLIVGVRHTRFTLRWDKTMYILG